jgi:hypothetical protein
VWGAGHRKRGIERRCSCYASGRLDFRARSTKHVYGHAVFGILRDQVGADGFIQQKNCGHPETPYAAGCLFYAASARAVFTIDTTALPNGTVGLNYRATLRASGGTLPYTWTISEGSLPPGLNLAQPTGVISGVPTKEGAFTFTVKATDKNSTWPASD